MCLRASASWLSETRSDTIQPTTKQSTHVVTSRLALFAATRSENESHSLCCKLGINITTKPRSLAHREQRSDSTRSTVELQLESIGVKLCACLLLTLVTNPIQDASSGMTCGPLSKAQNVSAGVAQHWLACSLALHQRRTNVRPPSSWSRCQPIANFSTVRVPADTKNPSFRTSTLVTMFSVACFEMLGASRANGQCSNVQPQTALHGRSISLATEFKVESSHCSAQIAQHPDLNNTMKNSKRSERC